MLRTEKRTINGATYQITQLAAREGLRVYRKLHQHLLPPIGALADAHQGKASFEQLARVVGELIADDDFFALVEKLFETCTCDGVLLSERPEHWSERLGDLHEVAWFAIEANYKGAIERLFRDGAGMNLEGLAQRFGASKSPSTSTPSSPR